MDINGEPKNLPLVGLIEIAQRAGVNRVTVSSWRTRYEDFPAPVAILAIGPIFWWPHVQTWLIATGRRHDADLTPADVSTHREGEKIRGFKIKKGKAKRGRGWR